MNKDLRIEINLSVYKEEQYRRLFWFGAIVFGGLSLGALIVTIIAITFHLN
jgi:hypothetical protein